MSPTTIVVGTLCHLPPFFLRLGPLFFSPAHFLPLSNQHSDPINNSYTSHKRIRYFIFIFPFFFFFFFRCLLSETLNKDSVIYP